MVLVSFCAAFASENPQKQLFETKPICRHGQRWARAGNDARGGVAGAHCVKRTQFAPPRLEKALVARATSTADPGGQRAKRSQFAPHRPEEVPADRAASTVAAGAERAKQSQLLQSDAKGKYLVENEL